MKFVADIFFLMLSVPIMLLGCVSGYMFEAFMNGVRQGRNDYQKAGITE